MTETLTSRCQALVSTLGLGQAEDVKDVTPLTGGVASDIASFALDGTTYCVKFALPKLKVAADWQAPVHRNAAEYAWLDFAAKVAPDSAVQLFGRSETAHGFVMEFVPKSEAYLWKAELLQGRLRVGEAAAVGALIGRIHAASAAPDFDAAPFQNRDDFHALRLDPYLHFTAKAHPEVAETLTTLAKTIYAASAVLVHGDVSPKNILFRESGPIILDAECATMGDASFDPAFCLNHLVLKAIYLPQHRAALLKAVSEFWAAYAPHVTWEEAQQLEQRVCRLLPALMLGRVDGKSPVEYLNEPQRAKTRALALTLLQHPAPRLAETVGRLETELKDWSA